MDSEENRDNALQFLQQIEDRHNQVLDELDQLNDRIQNVLDAYLKSRKLPAAPEEKRQAG